jgi:uncharacterized membrane protein
MNLLLLATAAFLLVHVGLASTPLRPALVGTIGEGPYRGVFSVLSLAALVWMGFAYAGAPREVLWVAGPALRAVPLVVMPVALLGLVLGNSAPSPAAMGPAARGDDPEPARGILRVTRHPGNLSIALWAAAHLAANGDAASVAFFGGLLLLAAAGPALIDRRRRAGGDAAWARFEAVTSIVPFAAILAGRNRFVPGELGWKRVAVALALYAALIWVHPWLFGVRPY